MSEFSFEILMGISVAWVVFKTSTAEIKTMDLLFHILIAMILGWFWYFIMGLVLLYSEVFKLYANFDEFKVYAVFWVSVKIFSLPIKVISSLGFILSEREGSTVPQICLLLARSLWFKFPYFVSVFLKKETQ